MRTRLAATLILLLAVAGCATGPKPVAGEPVADLPAVKPATPPATPVTPSFRVTRQASDAQYAYSPDKPVKVGGPEDGPLRERLFLSQLAGPKGENITYRRVGSCCPFTTPNGFMGSGLLDVYEVVVEGESNPRKLFINMYDFEEPLIPAGFTLKNLLLRN
jgi:hypothetical protein